MHDHSQWQVYNQNGESVAGCGAVASDFESNHSLVMANVHVWLWRQVGGRAEILLQKRSLSLKRSPGKFHISAAGHVDLGETLARAAQREAQEELGILLDPNELYLVQTVRSGTRKESLNTVFVYRVGEDVSFRFDDGEVDSVTWVSLDEFRDMAANAEQHNLINQGASYFAEVVAAVERLSGE